MKRSAPISVVLPAALGLACGDGEATASPDRTPVPLLRFPPMHRTLGSPVAVVTPSR